MKKNIFFVYYIKEAMWTIRKKDSVFSNGRMVECIKVIGKTESNMEKVFWQIRKKRNWKQNGLREKELKIKTNHHSKTRNPIKKLNDFFRKYNNIIKKKKSIE